jgi:hypothetical protein
MSRLILLAALIALAPAANAQESVLEDIRKDWTSCSALLGAKDWTADAWTGWRQTSGGNGYRFQFWDRSWDRRPSVLKEEFVLDGAAEHQTSCFRADGTLAFVLTEMTAPNVYGQSNSLEMVVREGRIYVSPKGKVIRVTGQVSKDGKKVGEFGNTTYDAGRPNVPLDLHLTLDRVRAHEVSELGDERGKRPAYTPNPLNWQDLVK